MLRLTACFLTVALLAAGLFFIAQPPGSFVIPRVLEMTLIRKDRLCH